ncbi:hypothetical protein AVEN_58787-1 [Araneus ventricosus]|uniref:Uncharacterized protein n=1 Tax=Araneus ventricosus TaxID=182803 RepID=A0A4Y2GKQ4_ARAVE|nr:hypothetical protein AVEN_58787-1 [Araneus ventricosus]
MPRLIGENRHISWHKSLLYLRHRFKFLFPRLRLEPGQDEEFDFNPVPGLGNVFQTRGGVPAASITTRAKLSTHQLEPCCLRIIFVLLLRSHSKRTSL